MTNEQWLAIRKEAAVKIDPETAEVCWTYTNICDPYGVYPDVEVCVAKVFFARPSGSDVWVTFNDLPDATIRALEDKQAARRASPEPTVYRRATELLIKDENQYDCVHVRIEHAPKLIEKLRAALKEIGAEES
jgi:hypothetical protein